MPNLTSMRIRSALIAAVAAAGLALAGAPAAHAADVPGFTGTWLDSALRAQYDLGSDLAFKNAPLLGTHNSFNSTEELGSEVTTEQVNQTHDLTDQLDYDVRSLELDLHRDPKGGETPVVCHTLPKEGCTVTKPLDPFLDEIATWLRAPDNSDQVVVLYLEDDLDDLDLHDAASATIRDELGKLVYRPERGGGCEEVPGELTRDDVLAAGAQVVIVSGCGTGRAWRGLAFSWERHLESRPHDFADYPDCGPDYRKQQYQSSLIRYYEDSTRVAGSGGADDGLTPESVAAMERCGVDLLSFDRIEPLDGRLEASVWSWAVNEPSRGRCALMRTGNAFPYGRWISKPCGNAIAVPACRNRSRWSVGKRPLDLDAAARWCERHDATLAVPRTGFENQQLRAAMKKGKARTALLGYRLMHGVWTPLDTRGG